MTGVDWVPPAAVLHLNPRRILALTRLSHKEGLFFSPHLFEAEKSELFTKDRLGGKAGHSATFPKWVIVGNCPQQQQGFVEISPVLFVVQIERRECYRG
jgi:hypothetical protein